MSFLFFRRILNKPDKQHVKKIQTEDKDDSSEQHSEEEEDDDNEAGSSLGSDESPVESEDDENDEEEDEDNDDGESSKNSYVGLSLFLFYFSLFMISIIVYICCFSLQPKGKPLRNVSLQM